ENNISPNAHSSEHVYDSIRFVDYIIIFYDKQFWNSKEDAENQVRIKCFFEHAYTSSNKLVSLYRFKVPDEIKSLKNTDGISKSNINSRTMNQHKLQLMSAYLERFKENPNILKN
ncbi:MAG TPA: hypothetical protein DCE80_01985, partial [Ignavibacteriales bacterium]|nr:hypothetical protein [Ignavibacteriales bacterium]